MCRAQNGLHLTDSQQSEVLALRECVLLWLRKAEALRLEAYDILLAPDEQQVCFPFFPAASGVDSLVPLRPWVRCAEQTPYFLYMDALVCLQERSQLLLGSRIVKACIKKFSMNHCLHVLP